jgi:heme/copper-type cytochrome/quinol oxidase subunit 3
MIGTAFIAVGLWRVLAYHSTDNHHLGTESSILYWHFVDIVWLFCLFQSTTGVLRLPKTNGVS